MVLFCSGGEYVVLFCSGGVYDIVVLVWCGVVFSMSQLQLQALAPVVVFVVVVFLEFDKSTSTIQENFNQGLRAWLSICNLAYGQTMKRHPHIATL